MSFDAERIERAALADLHAAGTPELAEALPFTCTGEDVPGDPQHSYRNILKLGFEEDYVRENYAPPRR